MRFANWPVRLADFIESRRETPFQWGKADCCLFAADAVLAMTGRDFAASFRNTYDSALSARRIIADAGGVPSLVPFAEIEPGYAQRGDVVMLDEGGRDVLAVHVGHAIAAQGVDGVVLVAPGAALKSWRVPHA